MNPVRSRAGSVAGIHPGEAMLIGVPVLLGLIFGYRQRWVAEDAFISLRVVENILAGHGPVFNIGERIEVYTHPIWLFMVTLAGAVGLRPEYAAAYMGLFLSLTGIALAQLAAARMARHVTPAAAPRSGVLFPAGMLVFVSIPVVWDFLTSGLETGLTFAWLGLSFWLLVQRATQIDASERNQVWPLAAAAVFGLGPLVRPDLGIYSLAFLIALLLCESVGTARRQAVWNGLWLLVSFSAVLGVYQLFRMGYFATLVPNTALAKEAGSANWGRGWAYFTDFVGTYHLWLPLSVLFACWVVLLNRTRREHWKVTLVAVAPVAAALLHGLYIVWIGGDFMHGRLLLPALFGVLLPVAVINIEVPGQATLRAALRFMVPGVIVIWAITCALLLRWSLDEATLRDGIPQDIVNERQFFVEQTGSQHPLTVEDYLGTSFEWVEHGLNMRALAATYPRIVLTDYGVHPIASEVDSRVALVIYARSIGVQSHAAGEQVRLVDLLGLGDPLAGRMQAVETGRPGHEKQLALVWIHARYAETSSIDPLPDDLRAAVDTLNCGAVAELLNAVDEPLTMRRFISNIGLSWELTRLRIHPDPFVARQEICNIP